MKRHLLLSTLLVIGLLPIAGVAETITTRIIDFRDDAEEDITGPTAGDVRRSSSDLEIGNENGVEQWVGLRFQDLLIPPGAVINSASILFTVPGPPQNPDVGTLVVPILGELSANPAEFGDLTPIKGLTPEQSRILTTATTAWNIDPWFPEDSGLNTTTPDLSAIVQEVVDLAGWASGGSIAFVFQNDPADTSERIAVSFDEDPTKAAELTIDFTAPPSMPGDFDSDGDVDVDDIDFYSGNLGAPATGALAQLDLDQDGTVTLADHNQHVTTLVQTSNGQVGALLGDIDLDGDVDVLGDAVILVDRLGSTSPYSYGGGDVDASQSVDVLGDAARLVDNLGKSNLPGAVALRTTAVPEPFSGVPLAVVCGTLMLKRRRGDVS